MLEPYEWKHSRTVLRRESGSNPADLVDKLRDIGQAVGFNVFWDDTAKCVQVESDKPYTGIAPTKQEGEKTSGQLHQTDVDAIKKDVVTRTNTLRLNKGVAVLEVNNLLMDAAQVRADILHPTQ